MELNLSVIEDDEWSVTKFVKRVTELENTLLNSGLKGIAKGNSNVFPLKHTFANGIYIREMFIKEGGLVVGKLHKESHVWFLLKGKIEVATEEGLSYYTAPCYIQAPARTKRVIFAFEDSIFVNVHPNPNQIEDLEELENIYVCDSYESYNNYKLLKE